MKKRASRSASRSVQRTARRTAVVSRRPSISSGRGASPSRMNQRAVRQQALRQQSRNTTRVRPLVRPATSPQRVMPKRPAPPAARILPAQPVRRAARPAARPARRAARPGTVPAPRALRRQPRPAAAAQPGRPAAIAAAAAAGAAVAFTLNTAGAHADLAPDAVNLQYALSSLQDQSNFDDIVADLQSLDADLAHALNLLESARDRGYRYQKDLDKLANDIASAWQKTYEATLKEIDERSGAFQASLAPLSTQVPQLNARLGSPAAAPALRSTSTTVNGLLRDVGSLRSAIRSRYADVETGTYQLTSRLNEIHWALAQLDEAKFDLTGEEALVMAVKARWDREGDDDPEGILFLTNKRLVFERKEKVATKKILFITTEKELVHELLFAEEAGAIRSNKAQSKGLFGHQDFLAVEFSGKLGAISLHLDGQDSKAWSQLLEKVRSGKIEEDRAAPGSLSFRDLTGDITQADIVAIQAEVNALQDELQLAEPRRELEEVENSVRSLERDLGAVRARGYAIEKNLEADTAVLASQWERIKANAAAMLDTQSGLLAEQSRTISDLMSRLAGQSGNLAAARPVYMQLKSAIASAEAQAAAALETVYGQFDDYAAEVDGLGAHLDWIDWMLDAVSTASFQLLATESGVAATEAMYARPGMEPENGILFLTDQRLIWEDRVGDYEVKVEVPLSLVSGAKIDIVEMDGEPDEFLVFQFAGSAPLPEGRFDIAAPVGEEWLQMVGRARGGDYGKDRAIELDPAELERIQNAPTQCQNCGAQFTAPILRGQVDVVCEFCGVTTRI